MRNLLPVLLMLFTLQSCGQGWSLVKTDKIKAWRIDDYTIIYSRKHGPAGPHYYQYDIYKRNKYLSYAAYILEDDSCKLLFRERNDYYVTFDLCNHSAGELGGVPQEQGRPGPSGEGDRAEPDRAERIPARNPRVCGGRLEYGTDCGVGAAGPAGSGVRRALQGWRERLQRR